MIDAVLLQAPKPKRKIIKCFIYAMDVGYVIQQNIFTHGGRGVYL